MRQLHIARRKDVFQEKECNRLYRTFKMEVMKTGKKWSA